MAHTFKSCSDSNACLPLQSLSAVRFEKPTLWKLKFSDVRDVALGPNKVLAVADEDKPHIMLYLTGERKALLSTLKMPLKYIEPVGVDFDTQGYLYVSDYYTGVIFRLRPNYSK